MDYLMGGLSLTRVSQAYEASLKPATEFKEVQGLLKDQKQLRPTAKCHDLQGRDRRSSKEHLWAKIKGC